MGKDVGLEDDGARVVEVVTDEETAAACPECGVLSTSVKERATTRPRDVPYGVAPIRLVWHKTRWRCRETRCPRGSFTESLPSVPARSRLTTRLRSECGERIATDASCVQAAAARGLSFGAPTAAEVRLLLELTRNFVAIPNRRHQEAICHLARALADLDGAEVEPPLDEFDDDPEAA